MAYRVAASRKWMGNDGPWSTFSIRVGSPPQALEVLPASSASFSLVVLEEGCINTGPADCEALRGNVLDTKYLSTWTPILAADGSRYLYVPFPAQEILLPEQIASEIAVNPISLDVWGDTQNTIFLGGQLLAGYASSIPFLGLLGLSGFQSYPLNGSDPYNSTLQTLKNNSAVSGLTWGYTAGAKYRNPESYGSLTFGGFDSSLVDMDNALTDVDFPPGPRGKGNELTLSIKGIAIGDTTAESTDMVALLDTMVPDLWLPKTVCDLFEDKFGLEWNETWEMYLVNDTQRYRLQNESTSVSFDLTPISGSSRVVTITLPYSAFDHEVKYPLVNITDDQTTLHYFPLKRTPANTTNFLGRTFFQEAYVSADYEQRTFNVGQTLFPEDPVRAMSLVPIYPAKSSSADTTTASVASKSLEAGTIGGMVAGAFVLLSIIAALAWWIQRRRKSERLAKEARTESAQEPGSGVEEGDAMSKFTKYELGANSAKHELGTNVAEHELDMDAVKYELDADVVGHELDVEATATSTTGQHLEPHELEAESIQRTSGP